MKLFFFLNFIYFLISSFAWPSTFIPETVVPLFGICIYCSYFLLFRCKISFNRTTISIITAYLIYSIYCFFKGTYTIALYYIPPLFLCLLDDSFKRGLLSYVTKWYGITMCLSISVYLITFVIDLPSFGVLQNYLYPPHKNYIFFIQSTDLFDTYRFNAFFFEPGHCATVSAMLLFANRYHIKSNFYLVPILFSILLSLSLAGYVLLFLGFILLYHNRIRVMICLIIISFLGFVFVAYIWEGGDNPVNELIVARLEFDENKGIKGDNRAYMDTKKYLNNAFETGEIWTGLNRERFNVLFNHSIAGSGYKIFLLQYGIIGALLILLMYYTYTFTAPKWNRHFAHMFLLFIIITFLQRCYTFWFSWQLSFICSFVLQDIKYIQKFLKD